ncbi:MAG: exodeoxyribonuclease VII large subunit [Bacteroidales bacterium]
MPVKSSDRTIFSLSEVALSIQKTLSDRYTSSFWIKAEMNRLNHYPQSGHCYPDLVEKVDGKIVAEMRSTIWKDDFQRINEHFLTVLKEPLKNGIKILFCAKITFSPVYGLSLRILDIDPSWSLGELEKEKLQTIEKLHQDGVFDANRSLELPLLPQRLAIISVSTSKGYADFRSVIDENEWGYSFFHMLFPAILQGENAVESILWQLERIRKVKHHFDALAIIRGGGGEVGLTCYNNYDLSKAIALFPLPVITGIGHSTNETVAEMVSFKNTITPTDLADYLLQRFHNFAVPLNSASVRIREKVSGMLHANEIRMLNTVRFFKSVTFATLAHEKSEIKQKVRDLQRESAFFLQQKREKEISARERLVEKGSARILKNHENVLTAVIDMARLRTGSFIQSHSVTLAGMERNIRLLDPVNVLNRGYSISIVDGKALKSVGEANAGSTLKTILGDGEITSTIQSGKITENND